MSEEPDFRQLVELLPHAIWSAFADGRTEYINPAVVELTGFRPEETAAAPFAPVHPDDVDRVQAAFGAAVADGSDFQVQVRIRMPEGEYRWVLVRGRPVGSEAGGSAKLVGTATDIDDLVRDRSLLETLFVAAPIGLGFVDREFRFVRVNEALAAIDGPSPEQHRGLPLWELLPKLWPQLEPIYRRVLEGETVRDVEVSGETPAAPGERRHWLVGYYPVRVEGEIVGVGVVALETTARKRAEEELARGAEERRRLLIELLRAQERERRRIAANIHGDTLQVLAAVGLRLGNLKGELARAGSDVDLSDFEEALGNAQGRMRALTFELWPPSLERAGLVEAVSELLEHLESETGIDTRLEADRAPEPQPEVRGLLFRIVSEALANVREHARASAVSVELRTADGRLIVRIRDDGVGFDPSGAYSPGHLGLLEMRERAETAGGELAIVSSPGKGTTLQVDVPLTIEPARLG